MSEPCDLSATEARRLIGIKVLSPVELLNSCLRRIATTNPALNAMVSIDEEAAQQAARDAEQAVIDATPLGLLHGLPLGVEDLQATGGLKTTWGALLYKDHIPDQDEDGVANLRNEGAIILSKTNTSEFGAGANTKNLVYGATGNPFDPVKTCGSSSGGSAAALASGQVPLATGSDYGGGLRTPAAFCGIVGFRPSPGLVPDTGRTALISPFAVNGPMARTVRDAHLLLKAQIDIDKRDPFSSDDAMGLPEQLSGVDLGLLRVAFSADLGCAPVDTGIRKVFAERIKAFGGIFGEAGETTPDFGAHIHEVFETLRGIDFLAAHGVQLEKHKDLLGSNIIDDTERGMQLTARDVALAYAEQSHIMRRFSDFFDDFDVLICPAAAVSPFPHEQLSVSEINGETMPTSMRWLAICYAPTTALACVATLPCGLDHQGMPFGIQVIGPNGADALVLEVACAVEQVLAVNETTMRAVPDFVKLSATQAGW